jgi:hypothetical protein
VHIVQIELLIFSCVKYVISGTLLFLIVLLSHSQSELMLFILSITFEFVRPSMHAGSAELAFWPRDQLSFGTVFHDILPYL